MNRALPFVLPFALLLGACSSHSGPSVTHQAPGVFGNTALYDAYVERRTNSLALAGVKPGEASNQAQTEAQRRYGPRTTADSVSFGHGWGASGRDLKMSDLDAALAKARD